MNKFIFIRLQNSKTIEKLIIDDIIYIESCGDYIRIITDNTQKTIHSRMDSFIEKTNSSFIIRCHRSFAININKVDSINLGTSDGILYICQRPIPLGLKYKKDVLRKLNYINCIYENKQVKKHLLD